MFITIIKYQRTIVRTAVIIQRMHWLQMEYSTDAYILVQKIQYSDEKLPAYRPEPLHLPYCRQRTSVTSHWLIEHTRTLLSIGTGRYPIRRNPIKVKLNGGPWQVAHKLTEGAKRSRFRLPALRVLQVNPTKTENMGNCFKVSLEGWIQFLGCQSLPTELHLTHFISVVLLELSQ
jgi:hypothetical protein